MSDKELAYELTALLRNIRSAEAIVSQRDSHQFKPSAFDCTVIRRYLGDALYHLGKIEEGNG